MSIEYSFHEYQYSSSRHVSSLRSGQHGAWRSVGTGFGQRYGDQYVVVARAAREPYS